MCSLTPAPSALWQTLDGLIVRQVADDLVLIEASGDSNAFALRVSDRLRTEFGDKFDDALEGGESSTFTLGPLPIETLAQSVLPGIDVRTIADALAWHYHQRPLRFAAGLIREEANRLREDLERLKRGGVKQ